MPASIGYTLCAAAKDLSFNVLGPLPANLFLGALSLLFAWGRSETGSLAPRMVG